VSRRLDPLAESRQRIRRQDGRLRSVVNALVAKRLGSTLVVAFDQRPHPPRRENFSRMWVSLAIIISASSCLRPIAGPRTSFKALRPVLTTCALRPVLTTLRGLHFFAMNTFDF
jgi:hypothetical protein